MSRHFIFTILFSVFFFLPFGETNAQRTGNILEYFGKERIENIDEGIIWHKLTNPLYYVANKNCAVGFCSFHCFMH